MQSVMDGEMFAKSNSHQGLSYVFGGRAHPYLLHDPFIVLDIKLRLNTLKFLFFLFTSLALLYLLYFKINKFF